MIPNNPGHKKSGRRWLIVLFVAVILAQALFLMTVIRERGLFDYVGLDYRGSRAAGEAILEHGLAGAYDSQLLEEIQRPIYDAYTIASKRHGIPFAAVPAPYPPPFSLAFVPSTFVPPLAGFLAWTLVHAAALVLYQLRLAKVFGVSRPGWLVAAVALSFPAFINLVMGQLSVWLVIFFGEALIAFVRGKHPLAGIWLGCLICKPQVLVLIVPALVVARMWRVLAGMALSAIVLLVPVSILSPGWVEGFVGGIEAAAQSSDNAMNVFPSSMTNWRAFAVNASQSFPSVIVWSASAVAMIATAFAVLSCSAGLRTRRRQTLGLAWLGLTAATCAFSWHSHVHQLLMLLPPMYLVIASRPHLEGTSAGLFLGSSALFLTAAFTLGVGTAHNILGLALLACLVVVTAACALKLRWELSS